MPNDQNWFINPYQFVPLGEGADRRQQTDLKGALRGRIHCILKTRTPLAIPDAYIATPDYKGVEGHSYYPFLRVGHREDAPAMIPGSTLRGMVRSVYEAATNSCLSVLEDLPLTARSRSFTQTAGLLKAFMGSDRAIHWHLYEGQVAVVNTFGPHPEFPLQDGGYRQGQKVRFSCRRMHTGQTEQIDRVNALGSGDKEGYLLIGELGMGASRRRNSHIIYRGNYTALDDSAQSLSEVTEAVRQLESVLRMYRDRTVNKTGSHKGYEGYELDMGEVHPVFYRELKGQDGKKEYVLSLAMQGREASTRRLADFAPEYTPCSCEEGAALCPACALFGQVNQKTHRSVTGRVRFTDALQQGEAHWKERAVTLRELSAPKITTTEFYTVRPNEATRIWNYVYGYYGAGRNVQPKAIAPSALRLRGRKFYLHHKDPQKRDYAASERNQRNSTMELMEAGSFAFDVYYDGLREEELEKLLWCLSPVRFGRNNEQTTLLHKLGHGRPLGLGSVEVTIEEVCERRIQTTEDGLVYSTAKRDDVSAMVRIGGRGVPEALKNILTYGFTDVRYPTAVNAGDSAGYQWFVGNRQIGDYNAPDGISPTGTKPRVKHELPTMPNERATVESLQRSLSLPTLEKQSRNDSWRETAPPRLAETVPERRPAPRQLDIGKTYKVSSIRDHMIKNKYYYVKVGNNEYVVAAPKKGNLKVGDQFKVIARREAVSLVEAHYQVEIVQGK